MGQSPSRTPCPVPVACKSWVPYVVRECEKAGSQALDRTIEEGIKKLVGRELGEQLIYRYSLITGYDPYAWKEFFPDSRLSTSTIVEGMNDECVECSCSDAAEKIIADCRKVNPMVSDAIGEIISSDGGILPNSTINTINTMNEIEDPITFEWTSKYYPGVSTVNEPFTNKEPLANNTTDVIVFTKNAINARHFQFKDTATFSEDCKNSSFYSMKNFIASEKVILDKLHNYYVTFVTSYESLYLHKEAVSKIITSKMDELEKIQSKIDSYKTNLHVDNRKNNYQNSNYEFYITVKIYMLILYYSLFVLYLIFSNFLSDKQYKNKKIVALILIYLLIPIILSYTINITYDGYIYFLEYYNLKDDTKSYADIIKA